MDRFFREQLSRLPFGLAVAIAVMGMPTDVFAFNERGIGHAHAAPWLSRTAGEIRDAISSLGSALVAFLKSPTAWRIGLAAAAILITLHTTDANAHPVMFMGLTIPELMEQKGRLATEADQILQRAADDKRQDLTSEEDAKFEAIHADIDKINKQVERQMKQEAVNASLTEGTGRRSHAPNTEEMRRQHESRGPKLGEGEVLRNWLLSGSAEAAPSAEIRSTATRMGVNLDSKTMRMRLPAIPMRLGSDLKTPDIRGWKEANEEHRAAMGVGSTTIGGYTVADAPMQALEAAMLKFGAMRQVATVIRTETGAALPFPTSDDTSNKGAILGENTAASEVDITVGQLVLDAYKYSSKYVLVSVELLQDSSINVAEFIGSRLGERIGRILNDHFTTGTGSSQPNGIVTAGTSSSVTLAGTATVTYDNLIDLIHTVDPSYRDNGKFMFHDGALKMLKKVKILQYSGDTVGAPLWQPSMVAGQPDLVCGYPYIVNQSMTTPATGVKSLVFGDLSKYLIRDVRDITLIRLDERFAEYHQVGFLAFSRNDGDLLDAGTHPVKYATQA